MSQVEFKDGTAYRQRLPSKEDARAPAALLLHGWPYSSYMWRHVLERVGDVGYRAIAPDLPGFGDTPLSRPGTWERHAVAIERLHSALRLGQVALVMHDWGIRD